MIKTCAIVVTYNRKQLLRENISALKQQTTICHVLIVDNASTDGTYKYIEDLLGDEVEYINTGSNLGGAGGFAFGVKLAEEKGYKYIWLMDDDSIPSADALISLEKKAENIKNEFSFLASVVLWTDKSPCVMNLPHFVNPKNDRKNYLKMAASQLLPISSCSFVGCFVNTDVSKKAGLPIAEFFIYGDDLEYTTRISKYLPGYLDTESIIIHKTASNSWPDVAKTDIERIDRNFYSSRNGMYIARKNGPKAVIRRIGQTAKNTIRILSKSDNKLKRLSVLYKGTLAGIAFNPAIEFSNAPKQEKIK